MPKFLPALRGGERAALAPAEEKAVSIAFADYYSALSGYGLHSRARDWPIERAVTEGFERVIWVFKAVNTIATDSARLKYVLKEDDQEVDDHPLMDLLNKKANPLESGQVFRKRLSAQILLSKRGAFVEVGKSNGGSPIRLDLLPPDRVEIIPGTGDDLVSHFRLTRINGSIRNIDPQNVRWFRDPHPIDPYMGTTPLESAGMSVELDYFARLYNVSFMQNDGRPGGVLAVRKTDGTAGDMDPKAMDRLEQRFGKGPVEAGKLSVVAGQLDYVDLAARPRDMQYGATSRNSKIELLSAFGVAESVLGYAAERTFDNADAELYNYWTRTLPGHHEIILAGFDEDSGDNLEGEFDTSKIEVLERAAIAKRTEARAEFEAGLRSIISYARLADMEDEIEDTPHTRALYIAQGKTPLPAKEADAEALGLATPVDTGGAPGGAPGDGSAPPADGAPSGPGAAPGAPAEPGLTPGARTASAPGQPGTAPAPPSPGAAAAALAAVAGTKSAGGHVGPKAVLRISRKAADERVSDASLSAADALEADLAEAFAQLADRWASRTAARLQSPKQRKGTRHWTPQYPDDTRMGTKALDTARAVDEQTWQTEAEDASHPIITAAAVAAALALFADLGVTPPPGLTLAAYAARAVAETVTAVTAMVGRAALTQAARLSAIVNESDQDGEDLTSILDRVRAQGVQLRSWAAGLGVHAATATTNGARDDAAREANRDENLEVMRVWFSRRDEKVRDTHAPLTGADGQTRGLDEPFLVGVSLLMFPGDPEGPLRETANCRCFLRYRSRPTGQWVSVKARDGLSTVARVAANAETRFSMWPRDGDSDGYIYDGTARQMPNPRRSGSVRLPRVHRIVVRPHAPAKPAQGTRVVGDDVSQGPLMGSAAEVVMRGLTDGNGEVPMEARALAIAAKRYDLAQLHGDDGEKLAALLDLLAAAKDVEDAHPYTDDDTAKALDELRSPSMVIPGRKALPRDGDSDGRIYDGTPREMAAPPRLAGHMHDPKTNPDFRKGYDTTVGQVRGQPVHVREQVYRDLEAMHAKAEVNSRNHMMLSGALAALQDLHPDNVDTTLNGVYDKPVTETPKLGSRIGEPHTRFNAISKGTDVLETVAGPNGSTVDRVLFRIERHDGVWGVHPPQAQAPALFSTGSKREAEKWAMHRAKGEVMPLRWKRTASGYLSEDGEWFAERGAPMSGGGTNAWLIMRRVEGDRIGRDGRTADDTETGNPLWRLGDDGYTVPAPADYQGPLYAHDYDAGSLSEAKYTIDLVRKQELDREMAPAPAPAPARATARRSAEAANRAQAIAKDRERQRAAQGVRAAAEATAAQDVILADMPSDLPADEEQMIRMLVGFTEGNPLDSADPGDKAVFARLVARGLIHTRTSPDDPATVLAWLA